MTLVSREIPTPIGRMLAVASEAGLCLLEFSDRRALPRELEGLTRESGEIGPDDGRPILGQTADALDRYFNRPDADQPDANQPGGVKDDPWADVHLDLRGTPFQRLVWDELRRIPAGETRSYADQARAVGRPAAVRAVARANGANQLAIVIPCHRVIGADGRLTGYGGGLDRKRRLLEHEGVAVRGSTLPLFNQAHSTKRTAS